MSDHTPAAWSESTWAERLEHVRESAGIDSLREFWRTTARGDEDPPVKYDAVRTYHRQGRTPPAEYLVRVSERFGVRLEWLLAGEGPVFKSEVSTEERSAIPHGLRALPHMHGLPLAAVAALEQLRRSQHTARWGDTGGTEDVFAKERWGDDVDQVWNHILAPLDGRAPLDWPAFYDYVMAAIHALSLAVNIPTTEEDTDADD